MSGFLLRLTHKTTAIGIVGVVLVGVVHLYGETAMAAYRDAAESAPTISELIGKVEVEWLKGCRAERDFLLRNDTKGAESQIEIGKSVAPDVAVLHEKVIAAGRSDLARRIEAMSTSLKQYRAHFVVVVEQKQQLGLNENSGLEGRLRTFVTVSRHARPVSRSSADSRSPSIVNLNFAGGGAFDFLISTRSIGPAT